jgi:hypothetical protein
VGETLNVAPEKPLRGAFIVGCFMFSSARVITEVPYDPYLYFEQEEATYSARLYTHGWDVFSPTRVFLYHQYNDGGKIARPLHWSDTERWQALHWRGLKRYHHLMGHELSHEPGILAELDGYGMGTARSLEDYFAFCGINYRTLEVSERGFQCGFIENLHRYRQLPFEIPPPPVYR